MAKGAEIYRKIEDAYASCNWAEISRLAKKYRRRGDLSADWEGVLEGMAGIWRAVERYHAATLADRAERLAFCRVDAAVLRETAAAVQQRDDGGWLLVAVQAALLVLLGECQAAVSAFNTTSIAACVSSPVAHVLFANRAARPPHGSGSNNSAKEIPLVECLVALHCLLFKGVALEGIQQQVLAVDQYGLIVDFYRRIAGDAAPAGISPAVRRVLEEALYRRAMLLRPADGAAGSIACATAIKQAALVAKKESIDFGSIRWVLLTECWLDVLPAAFRRHSLRTALDSLSSSGNADLVAENLEEERVWACEVMIGCLRSIYRSDSSLQPSPRHYLLHKPVIERLNSAICRNLTLAGASDVLIDFLKDAVYSRMPVGRHYYTVLFLALLQPRPAARSLSEAYMAGDILMRGYGRELDRSVRAAFLSCCYRLGLFDRIVEECARDKNSRQAPDISDRQIDMHHAKALLSTGSHSRADVDKAYGIVAKYADDWAEACYVQSVCLYHTHQTEAAFVAIKQAIRLDPGDPKYQLYHALLHTAAPKDYGLCWEELQALWCSSSPQPPSIDLTLAKARCERVLGQPTSAIQTLASRLSHNIAQAAAAAASSTIFSSSNDPDETASMVYPMTVHCRANNGSSNQSSDDNLSRASGFLSEPAVDILRHKIQQHSAAAVAAGHPKASASSSQQDLYKAAFPCDPVVFRAERLEHGLHIPHVFPNPASRLAAIEREQYSELVLLIELTKVYLEVGNCASEVEYCLECIRKLDSLLPDLYYLQGLHQQSSNQRDRLFEQSVEYGGSSVDALLALAGQEGSTASYCETAAYNKMLLKRLIWLECSCDYRTYLLLGQSCMQLGQFEEAGDWLRRAMEVETHSMLHTPML